MKIDSLHSHDPIYQHIKMNIRPLLYLDSLDDSAISRHNCSDHIWIHHEIFPQWISSDADIVTLVRLQNRLDQSVIGCIFGAHHGQRNDIYVPQWMYDALDFDSEEINITRVTPSMCTGIVLQPHTSDHLHGDRDPQLYLRDGFEQYSVLSPGQTLDLWIDSHIMTCTIIGLLPSNESPLAIRNCELTLELMPPLDLPIPEPPTSLPLAPAVPVAPVTETPEEVTGPTQEDAVTQRRRLAEAARNRLRP
jgi:hypothetical protein